MSNNALQNVFHLVTKIEYDLLQKNIKYTLIINFSIKNIITYHFLSNYKAQLQKLLNFPVQNTSQKLFFLNDTSVTGDPIHIFNLSVNITIIA